MLRGKFIANKSPREGALNTELLQRIDNMEDDTDYNPYQAIKRTTIETNELFNDMEYGYDTSDEDINDDRYGYNHESDEMSPIAAILTMLIAFAMLGLAVFMIIQLGVL